MMPCNILLLSICGRLLLIRKANNMTDRRNRSSRRSPSDRHSSSPRRTGRPCVDHGPMLPAPLVVAYEGDVAIIILSGEWLSPFAPPVYSLCEVDRHGVVQWVDLEYVSPQISAVRGCLDRAFIPDGLAVRLGEVADLLPPDLSGAEWLDVLSFDLGLALNGPVTADQRARVRGAVQMFNADAYSTYVNRRNDGLQNS